MLGGAPEVLERPKQPLGGVRGDRDRVLRSSWRTRRGRSWGSCP